MRGRAIAALAGVLAMLLGALAALAVASNATPDREITLVAKDMRFYVRGSDVPNPTLHLRAGETVRLVLVNEERGMLHDVAVPDLRFALEPIKGGDGARASGLLEVPPRPGRHQYVCTMHALTMKGSLEVAP